MLDKRSAGVITFTARVGERFGTGLTEVSEMAHKKLSGLMLKISRLLAPPIHPRVTKGVSPLALRRLISRAGRGDAVRSA
jgi:hypothetical protein